jgi:hypothetical protein
VVKIFSHLGDLVPGISAPMPWKDFQEFRFGIMDGQQLNVCNSVRISI